MKFVLLGVASLLSFVGALVAALAFTGNLNQEALGRLTGSEAPSMAVEPAIPSDELGPLAKQIKRKEEELQKRERLLKEREAQLDQREQGLNLLREDLEDMQKSINKGMEEAGQDRLLRLETVAQTVSEMKPDKAALSMENMPVDDVAQILEYVKPKDRGKIVEAMTPDQATRVLRALQEEPV